MTGESLIAGRGRINVAVLARTLGLGEWVGFRRGREGQRIGRGQR